MTIVIDPLGFMQTYWWVGWSAALLLLVLLIAFACIAGAWLETLFRVVKSPVKPRREA